MSDPAKKEATYDDLYRIPEHMTGQIIDGELIVTPRPAWRHSRAASSLTGEILPTYQFGRGGPGGWIIVGEPEIHFGNNVIVPDLAGWRRERIFIHPDEHRITVIPDWVCEILSPSTARIVKVKKMRIFAQYEVPFAWIIDPAQLTLEVLRLESGKWLIQGVYAENEKVRAEPFEEVEIDLANLWSEEMPKEVIE
jgi:Uma2 family endonuclease